MILRYPLLFCIFMLYVYGVQGTMKLTYTDNSVVTFQNVTSNNSSLLLQTPFTEDIPIPFIHMLFGCTIWWNTY